MVSAIVLVAESLFALAGSLCAQAVGNTHSANGSNTHRNFMKFSPVRP
jgi:hypothetical protein